MPIVTVPLEGTVVVVAFAAAVLAVAPAELPVVGEVFVLPELEHETSATAEIMLNAMTRPG